MLLAPALVSVALAGCTAGAAEQPTGALVVAWSPDGDPATTEAVVERLAHAAGDALGREVTLEQYTSADAIIVDSYDDAFDLALLPSTGYLVAVENGSDVDPLVQVDLDPATSGTVLAVSRPGSGVDGLDDFADRAVCLDDGTSLTGFVAPMSALLDAGVQHIDPMVGDGTGAGGDGADERVLVGRDCEVGFASAAVPGLDTVAEISLPGSPVVASGRIAEADRTIVADALLALADDAATAESSSPADPADAADRADPPVAEALASIRDAMPADFDVVAHMCAQIAAPICDGRG